MLLTYPFIFNFKHSYYWYKLSNYEVTYELVLYDETLVARERTPRFMDPRVLNMTLKAYFSH